MNSSLALAGEKLLSTYGPHLQGIFCHLLELPSPYAYWSIHFRNVEKAFNGLKARLIQRETEFELTRSGCSH